MSMKITIRLMLVLVLATLPLTAVAGDDEGTTESTAELGVWSTDIEGSPDMAAEYLDDGAGPLLDITVNTHQSWGSLLIKGDFQSSNQQSAALDFDIHRLVRSHTTYDKFLHRLGHDPMHNLEATSFNGKVVQHTDFNPTMDYDITYLDLSSRTELQLPSLSAVTFGVEFREQKRDGHAQAFTTSHCDTCHVKSQNHPVDQRTTDTTLDAKVAWKGGSLKGSYTNRSLTNGYPSVMTTFDDALHPELQIPIFDNRLQYDSDIGIVPADLWVDIDKNIGRLDLVLTNLGGFALTANGVFSSTENQYTGLKSDYTGYIVTAAKRFKSGLRLRWRGRAYSIDNDDVFVDVNDRVGIAGPQAGQTYEDIYGVNFDHTRMSARSRDAIESKLDLSYRFGRKKGTLRFLWDYDNVDRDNYEVLPGKTKTSTNMLGATWRSRPAKGLKLEAALRHADISNAFTLIDGACSTLVSESWPNPWNPDTPQYFEFQDERIAETTASPSSWNRADLKLAYSTGRTTLSAKYIYWDGDNSDGDLTDWSRTNQNATLTLWSAPAESWSWYAAYAWQESEVNSPACIPVFDG